MFDWEQFFNRNRIEYSESGPSTAKGNLYCHCPFCGEADKGKHMGVHLRGKGWGCWRNASHRGKAPARLIRALIGCSWAEAHQIAGQKRADPGGLERLRLALGKARERPLAKGLSMPGEFKPLAPGLPHWAYMKDRGFSREEVERLCSSFDLRMGKSQGWQYRVIIPVKDEKGDLQSWTGRGIGAQPVRYKTLAVFGDRPLATMGESALGPINDYFLRMEELLGGGKFLVLVEGPFDCMRVSLEIEEFDAQVTCLFGKTISAAQANFLLKIRDRYEKIFLALDEDAAFDLIRISSRYRYLGLDMYRLKGPKDPGDMSAKEIRAMLREMENRIFDNRN